MHHGVDPEWIDHKDRNRANNALENLRSVSMRQNNQNMVKRVGKSGYTGVNLREGPWRQKRFAARIGAESLGIFHTAEEAHDAYRKAANEKFGEFSPFRD